MPPRPSTPLRGNREQCPLPSMVFVPMAIVLFALDPQICTEYQIHYRKYWNVRLVA